MIIIDEKSQSKSKVKLTLSSKVSKIILIFFPFVKGKIEKSIIS